MGNSQSNPSQEGDNDDNRSRSSSPLPGVDNDNDGIDGLPRVPSTMPSATTNALTGADMPEHPATQPAAGAAAKKRKKRKSSLAADAVDPEAEEAAVAAPEAQEVSTKKKRKSRKRRSSLTNENQQLEEQLLQPAVPDIVPEEEEANSPGAGVGAGEDEPGSKSEPSQEVDNNNQPQRKRGRRAAADTDKGPRKRPRNSSPAAEDIEMEEPQQEAPAVDEEVVEEPPVIVKEPQRRKGRSSKQQSLKPAPPSPEPEREPTPEPVVPDVVPAAAEQEELQSSGGEEPVIVKERQRRKGRTPKVQRALKPQAPSPEPEPAVAEEGADEPLALRASQRRRGRSSNAVQPAPVSSEPEPPVFLSQVEYEDDITKSEPVPATQAERGSEAEEPDAPSANQEDEDEDESRDISNLLKAEPGVYDAPSSVQPDNPDEDESMVDAEGNAGNGDDAVEEVNDATMEDVGDESLPVANGADEGSETASSDEEEVEHSNVAADRPVESEPEDEQVNGADTTSQDLGNDQAPSAAEDDASPELSVPPSAQRPADIYDIPDDGSDDEPAVRSTKKPTANVSSPAVRSAQKPKAGASSPSAFILKKSGSKPKATRKAKTPRRIAAEDLAEDSPDEDAVNNANALAELPQGSAVTPAKQAPKKKAEPKPRKKRAAAPDDEAEATTSGFRTGALTATEQNQIHNAVEDFRVAKGLTKNEVVNLIQINPKLETEGKSLELWEKVQEACPTRPRRKLIAWSRQNFHNFVARGTWTAEQDEELQKMIDIHGTKWTVIGGLINRHPLDIRDRYRNYTQYRGQYKEGPWSSDEEERFFEAVENAIDAIRTGMEKQDASRQEVENLINWYEISKAMGCTRTRLQCLEKYKRMVQLDTMPDRVISRLPTGSSRRLDRARKELHNITNREKLKLVRAIRDTGVRKENKINWKDIVEKTFKDEWERRTLLVTWGRLRETVPDWQDKTVVECAEYLCDSFERERSEGNWGLVPSQLVEESEDEAQTRRKKRIAAKRAARQGSSRPRSPSPEVEESVYGDTTTNEGTAANNTGGGGDVLSAAVARVVASESAADVTRQSESAPPEEVVSEQFDRSGSVDLGILDDAGATSGAAPTTEGDDQSRAGSQAPPASQASQATANLGGKRAKRVLSKPKSVANKEGFLFDDTLSRPVSPRKSSRRKPTSIANISIDSPISAQSAAAPTPALTPATTTTTRKRKAPAAPRTPSPVGRKRAAAGAKGRKKVNGTVAADTAADEAAEVQQSPDETPQVQGKTSSAAQQQQEDERIVESAISSDMDEDMSDIPAELPEMPEAMTN